MQKKNFKIGVNENGFHFREKETGATFTLLDVNIGHFEIAIDQTSADEKAIKSLRCYIRNQVKNIGVRIKEFENITPDKCFISEENNLFSLDLFSGDGIGLLHEPSNKRIGMLCVDDGNPVIGFELGTYVGYEEAVKDFFELCSDNINKIYAGTYLKKAIIKREYDLTKIQREICNSIIEGAEYQNSKKYLRKEFHVDDRGDIIVVKGLFEELRIFCFNEWYYLDATKSSTSLGDLIIAIEAIKKFPEIKRLIFEYCSNGKDRIINITRKNYFKVLKLTLKEGEIPLEI